MSRLVSETGENVDDVFWKVHFYDLKERPLYMCTKYGGIKDQQVFEKIFGKSKLF
jgi:hypothetical protein